MADSWYPTIDSISASEIARYSTQQDHQTRRVSRHHSDKEIVRACKKYGREYLSFIDSFTKEGVRYRKKRSHRRFIENLRSLSGRNLTERAVGSAIKISEDPTWQDSLDDAEDNLGEVTVGFGFMARAALIIGGAGLLGVGFADSGTGLKNPKGIGWAAQTLGFSFDTSLNLCVAIFDTSPSEFTGDMAGLLLEANFGMGCVLGIHLVPKSLDFLGITLGIGVGLGSGASLMRGGLFHFG